MSHRVSKFFSVLTLASVLCTPLAYSHAAVSQKDIDAAIAREIASDPLTAAVQKNLPYVIPIGIIGSDYLGAGTGIIVSKNGFILTNKHVVYDTHALYYVTLPDGTKKKATIWYKDPDQDFALIKINTTFSSAASFGSSKSLKLGQRVGAIGNAGGLFKNAISAGSIFDTNRAIHASAYDIEEDLTNLIETTAPLSAGYSGGPLIATNGTIVGLLVAEDTSINHSYAVPIDQIKARIASYLTSKI